MSIKKVGFTFHAMTRMKQRNIKQHEAESMFLFADPYYPSHKIIRGFDMTKYAGGLNKALFRRIDKTVFVYVEELYRYLVLTVYLEKF
jgi:hypothetical protein